MKTNKFTYALSKSFWSVTVLGLAAALSFSACGKKSDDVQRSPTVGNVSLSGIAVGTLNGESIRVTANNFKLPPTVSGNQNGYPYYGNVGTYIRTYSNTGSSIYAPTVTNSCYSQYGGSCQIAYAEVMGTTSSSTSGSYANQRFEATIDYMILNTSNGTNTDVAYLVTVVDYNNQTEVKQLGFLVRFANTANSTSTTGTVLAAREINAAFANKITVLDMGNMLLTQAPQ